jgi:hypothetical protein
LCTHQTPDARRLAAMPEVSASAFEAMVPTVDAVNVCAQAASSTGGFGGGDGGG